MSTLEDSAVGHGVALVAACRPSSFSVREVVPNKLAVVLRNRAEVKKVCDDHTVDDKAEPAAQDEREDGDKAEDELKEELKVGDKAEDELKVGDKAKEKRKVGDKAEKQRKVGDKADKKRKVGDKAEKKRKVGDEADEELSLMLQETDEVLALCNKVIARSENAMGFEP